MVSVSCLAEICYSLPLAFLIQMSQFSSTGTSRATETILGVQLVRTFFVANISLFTLNVHPQTSLETQETNIVQRIRGLRQYEDHLI